MLGKHECDLKHVKHWGPAIEMQRHLRRWFPVVADGLLDNLATAFEVLHSLEVVNLLVSLATELHAKDQNLSESLVWVGLLIKSWMEDCAQMLTSIAMRRRVSCNSHHPWSCMPVWSP